MNKFKSPYDVNINASKLKYSYSNIDTEDEIMTTEKFDPSISEIEDKKPMMSLGNNESNSL